MKKELVINDNKIGFDTEPYIIAELSGNHNGDINRAIKLIDAAVASGANAIMMGLVSELSINAVLVVQVSGHCKNSIKETDINFFSTWVNIYA